MSDIVQRIAMKAVIVNKEGKVLLLREAKTYEEGTQIGRYQVPGGRIDIGEPFEEGLKREVKEETGLEVELQYPLYVGEWRPVIKGTPHQIIAVFFVCSLAGGEVTLSSEHDEFRWIKPSERIEYDLMDPEEKVVDKLAEMQAKAL